MLVQALVAERFRNLVAVNLVPHPRFNVLSGENGQGKTNIIEAIYLIATLRSFRTNHLDELVRFGESDALLRARFEHRGMSRVLGVELGRNPAKKQALVDGKAARAGEYFGGFNVVLFAPEDLRLPKGPPSARRRFLDRAIWNTWPGYLDAVRVYDRVLRSRNTLLRTMGERKKKGSPSESGSESSANASEGVGLLSTEDQLSIYDRQLAAAGAVITNRRRQYIHEIAEPLKEAFTRISKNGLTVEIRYEAALEDEADPAARLLEQLARDRRRDLLRGFTHSGPHSDDFILFLDGRNADLHASQGQLRALVLSLKIAEINHLSRTLGDAPVLLLDDVSSELDAQRNAALFSFLREIPSQVFITTTSPEHVRLEQRETERRDFRIAEGRLLEEV